MVAPHAGLRAPDGGLRKAAGSLYPWTHHYCLIACLSYHGYSMRWEVQICRERGDWVWCDHSGHPVSHLLRCAGGDRDTQ